MTNRPVANAERELILAASAAGTPWTLVARLVGRNRRTVTRICQEAGHPSRSKGGWSHGRTWSEADIALVAQVVPQLGYLGAAKATGRSVSVVRVLCRTRLAIASPLRPGRPRKQPIIPQETGP